MTFQLKSPAFANGEPIPRAYTQQGGNQPPPLAWQDLPKGTKSLVLVVEDPDAPAGTVTHWVAYDIPPTFPDLTEELGDQLHQAVNDLGHARYDGPKPPKGHGPHHYHFRLAALDTASLGLMERPSSNDVKKAARGHILAETELIGTFEMV